MTNAGDVSRDDDDLQAPVASERTPPSALLVSPLLLARALADALRKRESSQDATWRIACALSLNIVDLLESPRADEAPADEIGADPTATRFDSFLR